MSELEIKSLNLFQAMVVWWLASISHDVPSDLVLGLQGIFRQTEKEVLAGTKIILHHVLTYRSPSLKWQHL